MHCNTCKFFKAHRIGDGVCVRYPHVVSKGPHDWCGEYQEAPVKPVVVEEAPEPETKPKRGRK